MIDTVIEEKCDGCGVCIENCPVGILRIVKGKVEVGKQEMCTSCNLCREVCPKQAFEAS